MSACIIVPTQSIPAWQQDAKIPAYAVRFCPVCHEVVIAVQAAVSLIRSIVP